MFMLISRKWFKKLCDKAMQPHNVHSVLAIGENFENVLFRIAISFAENGLHVWFISPQTFNKAPKNIQPPDKEILQLITFMYLKDYTDLVTQLNGIHLWRKIPSVIIVTGFEHYSNLVSPEYNSSQTALTTTSLLDSAAVCARKKNENIKLLVTCSEITNSDVEKLQVIRDLYFKDCVYKVDDDDFFSKVLELFK